MYTGTKVRDCCFTFISAYAPFPPSICSTLRHGELPVQRGATIQNFAFNNTVNNDDDDDDDSDNNNNNNNNNEYLYSAL